MTHPWAGPGVGKSPGGPGDPVGVAPVAAWPRGTCWASSGASVPVGCQGVWGYPRCLGGLWSLLGDPVLGDSQLRPAQAPAARAVSWVTVKGEVTPAAVTGICHETACSGQRDKGAPEARRKEQLEQELIWELGRRAGAVPGGDCEVSAARRCCGNSQTIPLPTEHKRCSRGCHPGQGSGTPTGTWLCPALLGVMILGLSSSGIPAENNPGVGDAPCPLLPGTGSSVGLFGEVAPGKVQAVGGGGEKNPWEVSWQWEGAWGGVQTNVLLKAGSALRSQQVLH